MSLYIGVLFWYGMVGVGCVLAVVPAGGAAAGAGTDRGLRRALLLTWPRTGAAGTPPQSQSTYTTPDATQL